MNENGGGMMAAENSAGRKRVDDTGALSRALVILQCPVCQQPLRLWGKSVLCPERHTFDLARQGYLSLLSGQSRLGTGDTAQMVAARESFLASGHYQPLGTALAELAHCLAGEVGQQYVVDLAGGTGYYLSHVLDVLPGWTGVTVDASKFAVRAAARAHSRAAAIAADVWAELPFANNSTAIVMSIFGPRNAPEIERILRPGGVFIVVTPTDDHLRELVETLGLLSVDDRKQARLDAILKDFELIARPKTLTYSAAMTPHEIEQVVLMGPSARHLDHDELARRITGMPATQPVTVSVRLAAYVVSRRSVHIGSVGGPA
ncbi:MAG: hypothetical protein DLM55_01220 [Acidimicrobiales bacterium]|nr:MAG: hypothetical protein DLM55_01220 [Acidimicrobiales bacterium]